MYKKWLLEFVVDVEEYIKEKKKLFHDTMFDFSSQSVFSYFTLIAYKV